MRQSHKILSNAGIIWATQILMLVPQVILVPYLIKAIGEVGYGVYALVWALMTSIDQLEKSLQSGVVKYSAAFIAQGLTHEVNKVVSSSFVYSLFLAVFVCIGIIVAAAFYNDTSAQIGGALVVVGVMLLFIVPLTPYIAVIQSRQRYYVGAIAETSSRYISLLAVVMWFNIVGPSVEALIFIMASMMFLSRLAQVPIAYRFVPGLQNNLRLFDKKSFRLIAAFGAATVLASACLAVNSTGVRWLMDALVSTRFVAHLAIMLMPAMLLTQIIGAVTTIVMPATSAYEATGNHLMLQELLIRGMRYTTILALAGLLVAGLLMRNVLNLWVGPDYVFLAPYALVLFAARSFMLSTSTAHHMLKGLGKLKAVVFTYLTGLVIVPIAMILVIFKLFHDPYVSVTAGLATGCLVCGCLQIGFSFKAVHAKLRCVLMRAYAQPLLYALICCFVSLFTTAFFGLDGFFERIFVSIITVFLFLGCFYSFFATNAERRQTEELIQLALSKIAAFTGTNAVHKKN